jgi:FkbM family methyltransferase
MSADANVLISYAQNLEDVMLWRALRQVGTGFYIDVGANDPTEDSVTRGFYDLGWSGINIEPLEKHFEDLVAARPRDVNLRLALGRQNGQLVVHETTVRGTATARETFAAQYRASGKWLRTVSVPMQTLASVCEEHVTAEIHFLKIDVEGYEREVLEGADFRRYRPWVLVIEAIEPSGGHDAFTEWEPIVLQAGYRFAYFDGLNRFYVARERAELIPRLSAPPNVHDAYTFRLREGHYFSFPADTYQKRIAELSAKLGYAVLALRDAQAQREEWERRARSALAQLDRVRSA